MVSFKETVQPTLQLLLATKKSMNLKKDIDQKGIRIIMLYQPVASDLRLVTSIMKVSPNLERIGDQSVGIAKGLENE